MGYGFRRARKGNKLGPVIRAIRRKLDLSQSQLGEQIGCSGNLVSQYETRSVAPPLERLQKLLELAPCGRYSQSIKAELERVATIGRITREEGSSRQ